MAYGRTLSRKSLIMSWRWVPAFWRASLTAFCRTWLARPAIWPSSAFCSSVALSPYSLTLASTWALRSFCSLFREPLSSWSLSFTAWLRVASQPRAEATLSRSSTPTPGPVGAFLQPVTAASTPTNATAMSTRFMNKPLSLSHSESHPRLSLLDTASRRDGPPGENACQAGDVCVTNSTRNVVFKLSAAVIRHGSCL